MEEPDWQLWRSFLAVLQTGSLSAAARQMGLTQPTLGRQIASLEQELGTTLFTRSTEGLRPTEMATGLGPHAAAMAASASALMRAASGNDRELRGTVRLTASDFMGVVVLPPMLALFHAEHPAIEIDLALTDKVENLLRRDADIAVRNVAPAQDALLARRIGDVPIKLYAHRDYVARHGAPTTMQALDDHVLIGRAEHLPYLPAGARALHFQFRCSSDVGSLAALRAGFGIGYCQSVIGDRDPDLIPVLPDQVLARLGIWLATHEDLRAIRRVRVLMDFLATHLGAYVESA